MLYLKEANFEDIKKEYEVITNQPKDENGFMNEDHGCSFEEFETVILPREINHSKGIGLNPGYVPSTLYFLWDDDEIVGVFHFRHHLCEALENGAGHIGYGIVEKHRGKGYATEGLKLMLDIARKIVPEEEIYLSVHKDNPASLKVQMENGAYIHHEDGMEYFTRIKK